MLASEVTPVTPDVVNAVARVIQNRSPTHRVGRTGSNARRREASENFWNHCRDRMQVWHLLLEHDLIPESGKWRAIVCSRI